MLTKHIIWLHLKQKFSWYLCINLEHLFSGDYPHIKKVDIEVGKDEGGERIQIRCRVDSNNEGRLAFDVQWHVNGQLKHTTSNLVGTPATSTLQNSHTAFAPIDDPGRLFVLGDTVITQLFCFL